MKKFIPLLFVAFFAFCGNVTAQIITTIAGNEPAGYSGDGGAAIAAQLNSPAGVAIDGSGNIYISDGTNRIRKVSASGIITTIAGNGVTGYSGDGGPATTAELGGPYGIAVDSSSNLNIADKLQIRKVNSYSVINTIAGGGSYTGSRDTTATVVGLGNASSVSVDGSGNVYISDAGNNNIRVVSPAGNITTIAGGASGGTAPYGDGGPAMAADLVDPQGVVSYGGDVYIADEGHNRIRKISGGIITTYAGGAPGGGAPYGDGGAATAASLSEPIGIAFDGSGNMYIADAGHNRIREVSVMGVISTIAGGSMACPAADDSVRDCWPATAACLSHPVGVSVDGSGNVYIVDQGNNRIRKVGAPSILPITGTTTLCVDATTTLTDATATITVTGVIIRGVWSSSNPSVANVDMSTGVVSGVAYGADTITYTFGSSCITAKTVTVNCSTSTITGTTNICTGTTTTLSDATTGGTWSSSNTTIATVGIGTGIVSGITAGIATIYYTVSGISVNVTITVNPFPSTITGPSNICSGSTSSLGDATTGGTWSSSNTVIASVGSTGIVSGIASGSTTISYTLSADCTVGANVTVNAAPASITGISNVCIGSITTLSDATTGGTWSSSNTAIASVGSTGIVSDIASGSTTISYTLPTGCAVSTNVTVNAMPPLITGTVDVCTGSTTTLNDATSGGTWSSGAAGIATIGSAGVVTGVSAGTSVISYTLGTACPAITTVTVNTFPIVGGFLIDGVPNPSSSDSICIGTTITLTNDSTGGTWSSSDASIATIGLSSGIVYPVYPGGLTTISYTITNACGISAPAYFTLGVDTPVTVVGPISGSSLLCVGSYITLTDFTTGGVWTSGHPSNASIGSLSGLMTGLRTGTDTVYYNIVNSCGPTPSSYAQLSVTIIAPPHSMLITGPDSVCEGATALYHCTPFGTGDTYLLWASSNTAVAVVGSSTGDVTGVSPGTATLAYTLGNMCGSLDATKSVTVTALPIAGTPAVCTGFTTTLSETLTGGAWTATGGAIATVGSGTGIVMGIASGTAVITFTGPTGCRGTDTVTVNPLPAIYTLTGGGSYCAGGTGMPVGLSGSLAGVSYQLYVGATAVGTAVAGTGSALAFGLQTAAGAYTVVATNIATGCTSVMAGSVSVTITAVVVPSVSMSASPGAAVCAGVAVTFTATPAGGGPTPAYVWTVNGIAVSSTDSIYSYTPVDGDIVAVTTTTSAPCASLTTAGAHITMSVSIPVITASASAVACGGTYTLTAGGSLSYVWLPATGLSCTGCASPVADPLSTTTYTVTGTNASGCTGTASVAVDGNRISGYISPALSGTIRVWLIQFNPADSSLTALDSTTACLSGGSPFYEFDGPPAGDYMVKAYLPGGTPGVSGYTPTYSLSSPHWDMAATVAHTGATDTMHISMIYGTVSAGAGFISGYIASGADRGTTDGTPVASMLVYLTDAANNVITYTYTDNSGNYSFSDLADGSYIVYPEFYQYFTTASATVIISGSAETITGVDFKQHTISMTITPYNYNTAVKTVSASPGINVFPNPASDELNIQWENQTIGKGNIMITDIVGREVYKSAITMNAASGEAQIALHGMKNGVYIITIKSESIYYCNKLIIQQ